MVEAIRSLRIRGAPAIGIAAAVWSPRSGPPRRRRWIRAKLAEFGGRARGGPSDGGESLVGGGRMRDVAGRHENMAAAALWERLEEEALAIFEEDRRMCRRIGEAARGVIRERAGILTHCNAGGLATSGYGTALACAYVAQEDGKRVRFFADETRPLMQGSRLTAWELMESGVDVTLICDDMTAATMARGDIDLVIVGADRSRRTGTRRTRSAPTESPSWPGARNTVLSRPRARHSIFASRREPIPIEERDPAEVTHGFGTATAPAGVRVYSPAFDVTPARYITLLHRRRSARTPFAESPPPCREYRFWR